MIRRKKIPPKTANLRNKKIYTIDGIEYSKKNLYELHIEAKQMQEDGIITMFNLESCSQENGRIKLSKPIIDNYKFDSCQEAKFYLELKLLEHKGLIKNLELQKKYILQESFRKSGKTFREIAYVCDFYFIDKNNSEKIIDIKGIETTDFKIKYKLFEHRYPELTLTLIRWYPKLNKWMHVDEIKKIIKQNKKLKQRKQKEITND